ncbi:MAG: hypothetical protein LUQ69_10330 [Methanoregulaceae archaeon]|jgi:hypothetical protein|nr:hypothetical protein [Methanoregulaceae archaeon]
MDMRIKPRTLDTHFKLKSETRKWLEELASLKSMAFGYPCTLTDVLQDAVAYYRVKGWSRFLAQRNRERALEGLPTIPEPSLDPETPENGTGKTKTASPTLDLMKESKPSSGGNGEVAGSPKEEEELSDMEMLQLYVDQFNEKVAPICPNSARVEKLTAARAKRLGARVTEHGPGFWWKVRDEINQLCDFAREGHWLGFDWLLSETNCQKLLEGQYRRRTT